MAFSGVKTLWKLRDGITLPYACKEEPDNNVVNLKKETLVNNNLPLRKEADIYLSSSLNVDYVQNLITYLIRQGLTVGRFDRQHRFLAQDVILLSPNETCSESKHIHQVTDKRALWEFLKEQFKEVLKS